MMTAIFLFVNNPFFIFLNPYMSRESIVFSLIIIDIDNHYQLIFASNSLYDGLYTAVFFNGIDFEAKGVSTTEILK
ncbi:hypothetical protein KQI86_02645 [Clostridium sp. MSJ-11]|uniref:Uncharacterized protein n=1 Tax=Clostridium mobile TaxID=2841512 RepID=A0ABS6EDD6_9CLOT|nr:hypothetical protein [Clostridium mobile]MBU5483209.1 hypothetical protein [Clostridium mobile]